MTDMVELWEASMNDPKERAALAAAAAAGEVMGLLERAQARSGLSNKDIAQRLGISEGRVSQVMSGDGNYHIATVARFLSAMGSELAVGGTDVQGQSLARKPRVRRDKRQTKSPSSAARRARQFDNHGVAEISALVANVIFSRGLREQRRDQRKIFECHALFEDLMPSPWRIPWDDRYQSENSRAARRESDVRG